MISYISDSPAPESRRDRSRARVLAAVVAEPCSTLREIADELILSEGCVRTALLDLLAEGKVAVRDTRARRGNNVQVWWVPAGVTAGEAK